MARDEDDWADGKPVSRHSAGFGAFFSLNMMLLIGVGLCALIAIMGFVIRVDEAKESPVVGRAVAFGFTALTVGLLIWAIINYVRLIKLVEVFDEGIAWESGGRQAAAWDEIISFKRAERMFNNSTAQRDLTIETEDLRAIFRMHLSKWDKLADRIQEEVFAVRWPEAKEQYDSGEEVEFGPLSLGEEGITVKGQLIPWKRVKRVGLSNGFVAVHEKGVEDPHFVKLADVPNYAVFLRLIDFSPIRKK